MNQTTTNLTTLANDIYAEILVRCGTETWLELVDLCEIFSDVAVSDIHAALKALRSAKRVRLVACALLDGRDKSKLICNYNSSGDICEIYAAVEIREEE